MFNCQRFDGLKPRQRSARIGRWATKSIRPALGFSDRETARPASRHQGFHAAPIAKYLEKISEPSVH
jgi:hypothetical protein